MGPFPVVLSLCCLFPEASFYFILFFVKTFILSALLYDYLFIFMSLLLLPTCVDFAIKNKNKTKVDTSCSNYKT